MHTNIRSRTGLSFYAILSSLYVSRNRCRWKPLFSYLYVGNLNVLAIWTQHLTAFPFGSLKLWLKLVHKPWTECLRVMTSGSWIFLHLLWLAWAIWKRSLFCCLVFFWNPTQRCGDYCINHYKDPVINQPGFHGKYQAVSFAFRNCRWLPGNLRWQHSPTQGTTCQFQSVVFCRVPNFSEPKNLWFQSATRRWGMSQMARSRTAKC